MKSKLIKLDKQPFRNWFKENRSLIIVTLILILIGIFYIATIREGHTWGGDFSMYIQHAKNISEGVAYGKTGYILNPHHPFLGPKMFPPIFPILLSHIYKCFGLNLAAMKIEIILFFLFSLFIIYKIFRNQMLLKYPVLLIAVLGINPYFWNFKDNVLSDIPFLFFVYLSIFLINKVYLSNSSSKNQILNIVSVSILFYLCYETRDFGITLIPSLFIYDLVKSKKPSSFPVKVTLLFALFVILQYIFFDSHDTGRWGLALRVLSPKNIFEAFSYYSKTPVVLWDNGYSKIIRNIFFLVMSGTALIGYFVNVKKNITFCEIFLPFYLGAVIFCPYFQGIRYLIPIIPLYVCYVFIGVNYIGSNFLKHKEKFALIVLGLFIFVTYIEKYTTVDWGPIQSGIGKKETVELFNYIKKKTDKNDIFIFRKPRVLSFFTERKASVYDDPYKDEPYNDEELWDYFQKINATYIIECEGPSDLGDRFFSDFITRNKNKLQKVYSNPDFKLYCIKNDYKRRNLAGE